MMSRTNLLGGHLRVVWIGLAVLGCVSQGCAGRHGRDEASDTKSAYLSRFPTLGSDLKAAPRGVTIPASDLGIDLVNRRQGKMAKMVDDAIGQVAAPGFATIR